MTDYKCNDCGNVITVPEGATYWQCDMCDLEHYKETGEIVEIGNCMGLSKRTTQDSCEDNGPTYGDFIKWAEKKWEERDVAFQDWYEQYSEEHIDPNELSANTFGTIVWQHQQERIDFKDRQLTWLVDLVMQNQWIDIHNLDEVEEFENDLIKAGEKK